LYSNHHFKEYRCLPNTTQTLLLIILAAVLMLAGTLSSDAPTRAQDDDAPRTAYEALNLDTPTDALETALDAIRNERFQTLYWTLAPDVHDTFVFFNMRVDNEALTPPNLFSSNIGVELGDIREVVTIDDSSGQAQWHVFEQILRYTAATDSYWIDLRGDVQLGEPMPSAYTLAERPYPDAVDIPLSVDGVAGFTAVMVQTVDGDWKLRMVIAPGADAETPRPLFVVPDLTPLPPAPNAATPADGPRTLYDTLTLDTPAAAAQTFLDAWMQQDFLTAFMVLSPGMQADFEGVASRGFGGPLLGAQVQPWWFAPHGNPETLSAQAYLFTTPSQAAHYATQIGRVFDTTMLVSAQQGWLPMPTASDYTLGDATEQEITLRDGPVSAVTVPLTIGETDGWRIALLEGDDTNWRVQRIYTPGSADSMWVRGLFVREWYGEVRISENQPVYASPGGEVILTDAGDPLTVPVEMDGTTFTTYTVTAVVEVEGMVWLGIHPAQPEQAYVPLNMVEIIRTTRLPAQYMPADAE
jgi:hypothetical protein